MLTKNLRRMLIATTSIVALSGCGASDIASPGAGNVTINNTTNNPPAPTPTPTPTPTSTLVTAAAGCPTISNPVQLTDDGTISGPTGTYRICTMPTRFTRSSNLPYVRGLLYRMNSRVDVGTDQGAATTGTANVVLSIEPGAIIYATGGANWLGVNRGNQLQAVGTAARPIIFTSQDNIQGLNTDTSSGQWGGVVLLGRGQTTDCGATGAQPGTVACERQTEGAIDPSVYGGAQNGENNGNLRYVQIRYSGYILSANSELQSLTTESTGSATQINYIQSFNSSDDGAEFFGGRVNFKYFISVGAEDDNLDSDTGVKANFQYVLVAQRAGSEARGTDSIIEADSDNGFDQQLPRQNTIVSNYTFFHRVNNASNQTAILLRGGTDYTLINGFMVATQTPTCLAVSRPATIDATASLGVNATNLVVAGAGTGNDELGIPIIRSSLWQCSATPFVGRNGVATSDVQALFTVAGGNNSTTYTPSFTSTFINGATETAVPVFNPVNLNAASGVPSLTNNLNGQPAFFDAVTYAGAVRDANDTWYRQWTCNSTTLDLGTGNTGLCTSLPTFS